MWPIRDSLSSVFNKYNMVVDYFTLWAKRATGTSFYELGDFQFKKDDFGNEFVMFAQGITKTRQSGFLEKHRFYGNHVQVSFVQVVLYI